MSTDNTTNTTNNTTNNSEGGITLPKWFLSVVGSIFAVTALLVVPYMNKTSGNLDTVLTGQAVMVEQLKAIPELKTSVERLSIKQEESDKRFAASLTDIQNRVLTLELIRQNKEIEGHKKETDAKLKKSALELEATQRRLNQTRTQLYQFSDGLPTREAKKKIPVIGEVGEFIADLFTPDTKPVRRVGSPPYKTPPGTKLAKN